MPGYFWSQLSSRSILKGLEHPPSGRPQSQHGRQEPTPSCLPPRGEIVQPVCVMRVDSLSFHPNSSFSFPTLGGRTGWGSQRVQFLLCLGLQYHPLVGLPQRWRSSQWPHWFSLYKSWSSPGCLPAAKPLSLSLYSPNSSSISSNCAKADHKISMISKENIFRIPVPVTLFDLTSLH